MTLLIWGLPVFDLCPAMGNILQQVKDAAQTYRGIRIVAADEAATKAVYDEWSRLIAEQRKYQVTMHDRGTPVSDAEYAQKVRRIPSGDYAPIMLRGGKLVSV